ncbi:MAG: hypothetical protein FWD03_01855 [Defluviitaleaceae bacterium]|nr:hypothetical protein [Defluviitaleaceae bacterium]
MTTKRVLFQDMLYDITRFAVFYGVFLIAIIALFRDSYPVFLLLIGLMPFFINFLARHFIRNVILMIFAHLAFPVAAYFAVADFIPRIITVIILLLFMLYSLVRRIKGKAVAEEQLFCTFGSLSLAIMCFAGISLGHHYAAIVYPILIMVIIIGHAIYSRMAKVDMSLEVITQTSTQPVRQILALDHKMMPVLVAVLLLFTFVAYVAFADPLMRLIASHISIPQFETTGYDGPFINTNHFSMLQAPGLSFLAMGAETHPIWAFLDAMIYYLLMSVAALLAAALLITSIVTLYRLLGHKKAAPAYAGEDEKAFVIPEKVKNARRKLWDFFPMPEDKTRRMFRKKIMKHKKMGVPINKSDTPTQMVDRIQSEDISALATEYEKVRYRV